MSTSSGEKAMDITEENSRLLQGSVALNHEGGGGGGYGSQSDAAVVRRNVMLGIFAWLLNYVSVSIRVH